MNQTYVIFDWSTLEITGPDAKIWLNGLLTCDVLGDLQGQAAWGLLLTKQGKIQAEVLVTGLPEQLFVAVCGGQAAQAKETLEHYLVMEDAELFQTSSPMSWALWMGDLPDEQALAARGVEWMGLCPWAPADARLLRARATPQQLRAALAEQAQELSKEQWAECRIAWGLPEFESDFTSSDNPHQASLERRTVDWNKGCYLGQEVVCMQDMRGKVKRRLVLLTLNETSPSSSNVSGEGVVVNEQGKTVGQVTTRSGQQAIARVTVPADEPGTRVLVDGSPALVGSLGSSQSA